MISGTERGQKSAIAAVKRVGNN